MGSIRIEINTAQLDALIERLKSAPAKVQAGADAVIGAETEALVRRIWKRWPILTGYSITKWKWIRLSLMRWIITNQANYAGWVFAKGDTSRTPLLYTWIAVEVAMTRARLLVELRRMFVDVVKARPAGVRGGRIRMGA